MEGNRIMRQHGEAHAETREAIEVWLKDNAKCFKTAQFLAQTIGRGTAATAGLLIDTAMDISDSVVFTEDDVVFEADAVRYFVRMLESDAYARDDVYGVAGESKYFDLQTEMPSNELFEEAKTIAEELGLQSFYQRTHGFPSSCFGVNAEKWKRIREVRSGHKGPRRLGEKCQEEGAYVLWPIIARCRDIGMIHQKGYSMTLKKDANAIAQKASYLSSGMISPLENELTEVPVAIKNEISHFFGRKGVSA